MSNKDSYDPSDYEIKQWLILTSEGDEIAFARLLRSHWNKVYTQALTYLKLPQNAQEITQNVFVKIWSAREKLASLDSFSNFLFIVSRNEIISALRKKEKSFNDPIEELQEGLLIPDQQLEYKESYQRLTKAIEQLPPMRKIVFKMSRLEGRSYEEIGNELGISRNGVKDHIVKALNFLRTNLYFDEEKLLMLFAGSQLLS